MELVFGIMPCQLCLYQRYPYFGVLGLGALWLVLSILLRRDLSLVFAVGALILIITTGSIALYHMGVEWGIFQSTCSGSTLSQELFDKSDTVESLLSKGAMPPCDKPYLLLGLSLSTWNFLVSLFLASCIIFSAKNFIKRK